MRYTIAFVIAMLSGVCFAHEMTPTYPQLRNSFVDNVYVTTVSIFNRRMDVEFYEIDVFDDDWASVAFATSQRIVQIPYMEKKVIDIYIREEDKYRVRYICTRSKILQGMKTTSVVSSKICSKIK